MQRKDFLLASQRESVTLCCSLYTSVPSSSVVIYCHTNSGSRLEAMQGQLYTQVLMTNSAFLSFDFGNCGLSTEGD